MDQKEYLRDWRAKNRDRVNEYARNRRNGIKQLRGDVSEKVSEMAQKVSSLDVINESVASMLGRMRVIEHALDSFLDKLEEISDFSDRVDSLVETVSSFGNPKVSEALLNSLLDRVSKVEAVQSGFCGDLRKESFASRDAKMALEAVDSIELRLVKLFQALKDKGIYDLSERV